MKKGYQTTEFWISLVAMLLGALFASGIVPDQGPWERLCAALATVLSAMGYTVSRGIAKQGGLVLAACLTLAALTGCAGPAYRSDKITSIKTRTFGIQIEESPTTQTPAIRLGLVTTVIQLIPTSTNSTIYAPKFFDTFQIDQTGNPFRFGVTENTGSGDVMIRTNASGGAIIPRTEILGKSAQ